MNKFIKNIIKYSLIFLFFTIIFIFIDTYILNKNNPSYYFKINSRKTNIKILSDSILCEDILDIYHNSNNKVYFKFIDDSKYLKKAKLYIDNLNFVSTNSQLMQGYFNLNLKELNKNKSNITVRLVYELDKSYIEKNSDINIFKLNLDNKHASNKYNLTINLISNYNISNLSIKSIENAYIDKISDKKYFINIYRLPNNINSIDLLFKINPSITNKDNTTNINSLLPENGKEKYSFILDKIPLLKNFFILSILLAIISFIINRKTKNVQHYRRETTNLISPILAESIVDGKINLKNLIMTTILNLNLKGNIRIINNNTIQLISKDNLKEYELHIINLIFTKSIISFDDINNIFCTSNLKTLEFNQKMDIIQNSIKSELYSLKIVSFLLSTLNRFLGLGALLLLVNLPRLFINSLDEIYTFLNIISISIIFFFIKGLIKNASIKRLYINQYYSRKTVNKNFIILISLFITIIFFTLINIAIYYLPFFIFSILTLVLNIYTLSKSNSIILTKHGKQEQIKLLELKKYMLDYSLMKERDLQSVIIWDEYLTYATAFGIPNEIISSISEHLYNLNINLQFIATFFKK